MRTSPLLALLPAAIIVALAGCGERGGATTDSSSAAPTRDSAVVGGDSLDEPALLGASGGRVARRGPALEIRLADGRLARLEDDTTDTEEYRRHEYAGAVRGAPFHLVRVSGHESRSFLLVHEGTGKRIEIDAPPVLSPDGARFATASMDLEAAFDPTRLAIYRLSSDSAALEWSVEPEDWGPSEPRWVGADTLAFTRNAATGTPGAYERRPAAVIRTPDGWALRDR